MLEREVRGMNFNYDFKNKALSIAQKRKSLLDKEVSTMLKENQSTDPVFVSLKITDISTAHSLLIVASLLEDYHKELMKFISSQNRS
jgi:hypothetical protein